MVALAHAARCDKAPAEERIPAFGRRWRIIAGRLLSGLKTALRISRTALHWWGAEIARIEGRELDAERSLRAGDRLARANGFIHNEALAYELAARFYAALWVSSRSRTCILRNARYGYLRWGAVGKVRQLDETYPDLRQEQSLPGPTSTIGAPVEHLDLATVIRFRKPSQVRSCSKI